MMDERNIDFDLDVMNALKGFPMDDENALIYLRLHYDRKNDKSTGFAEIKGTTEALGLNIILLMQKDKEFAVLVLNTVLNYLDWNPGEQDKMINILKEMQTAARDKWIKENV